MATKFVVLLLMSCVVCGPTGVAGRRSKRDKQKAAAASAPPVPEGGKQRISRNSHGDRIRRYVHTGAASGNCQPVLSRLLPTAPD
jgi:hypothetical protein